MEEEEEEVKKESEDKLIELGNTDIEVLKKTSSDFLTKIQNSKDKTLQVIATRLREQQVDPEDDPKQWLPNNTKMEQAVKNYYGCFKPCLK